MSNVVRPGFCSIDSYLQLPRDHETWLLKPLIPASGAALLYGAPKLGKTYLAIQMALAISGHDDNWLGFPVIQHGRVLLLQLDTPRSVFAHRFDDLINKNGIKYNSDQLMLADRECIEHYPLDILQPAHMKYLYSIIQPLHPVAVIVDTLRESHSGDEDTSTTSRNVIANLVGATHPAALILVSHSRKSNPDMDKSLMDDHRGSSYIAGRMDAIMRLTRTRLYFSGRSIEEDHIKLQRQDNGLWLPQTDDVGPAIEKVLTDVSLPTLRAKARVLAAMVGKTEDAACSQLRREIALRKSRLDTTQPQLTEQVTAKISNDTAHLGPVTH